MVFMSKFALMKPRNLLIVLLALCPLLAFGQRRVVIDFDTELPVAQVSIQGRGRVVYSDSLGRFAVADSVRTLVFSHVNYESRIVNLDEVGDTVFLVPKYLSVKEVVVFGKGMLEDDRLRELTKSLRMSSVEAQLQAADPHRGNLLGLLGYLIPKKWLHPRKKETRKQRHERILNDY